MTMEEWCRDYHSPRQRREKVAKITLLPCQWEKVARRADEGHSLEKLNIREHKLRIIIITLFCTLLFSCGFSLRMPVQFAENMQTIAITPDDPYRPLQRNVREALMYSGVDVTSHPSESQVILKLQPEQIARSTYAVDTAGDVAQELLTYSLTFELVDKDNKILIPMQTIKTDRMLYIHNNQLLSVNREERTLIDDMRQEAVQFLIQRLAAYQP